MLILRAIVECTAPLHCGASGAYAHDQPVERDAFGLWRIPASSLAGSLRALGQKIDPALVGRMFGDQNASESNPSLIWCEDGLVLDYDGQPAVAKRLANTAPELECAVFVRDHVCIDLVRGGGVKGGKFDMEFVPEGTRFRLEFRCDGWDKPLSEADENFFRALCGQFLAGKLEIGGKNGLCYGSYRVIAAELEELDLRKPEDMGVWLNLEPFCLPVAGQGEALSDVPAAISATDLDGWLELTLICDGPILIGGGAPRSDGCGDDPDMVFALTPRLVYKSAASGNGGVVWQPVLPASSIRGVLRHAVYAILRNRGVQPARSEQIIAAMFGNVGQNGGRCGRIMVADAALAENSADESFRFVQHVALDRFSGGALEGALFSEEPFWRSQTGVKLRIGARAMPAHEAALLFHALLDLFEGGLAIGGGVNRGNGRLALAGWEKDRASALAALSGDMSWNGANILADGLNGLLDCARVWDAALEREVEA